jgi:hypothetical protein
MVEAETREEAVVRLQADIEAQIDEMGVRLMATRMIRDPALRREALDRVCDTIDRAVEVFDHAS